MGVTVLRRPLAALAIGVLACGCTFPSLATPTQSPTPSPTPSPIPTATPPPPGTPPPSPTPDLAEVPVFGGAEIVATAIDGLRVRQRPGTNSVVIAGLLPMGAELEVRLGPIPVDGLGWYLVDDADSDEPEFGEGWIAAGFEPEPFLRSTGREVDESPVVAAYALTGDAEHGPIEIVDADHAIRWIAVDPEGIRCRFGVMLEPADGEPVTAIRATVGDTVVPGTLQPSFFAAQEAVRGQVFLSVESDCAWALSVVRAPPPGGDPSPSP